MQKHKCLNYGACDNADNRREFHLMSGHEQECPECGSRPISVAKNNDFKKVIPIVLAALLLAAGILYFALPSSSDEYRNFDPNYRKEISTAAGDDVNAVAAASTGNEQTYSGDIPDTITFDGRIYRLTNSPGAASTDTRMFGGRTYELVVAPKPQKPDAKTAATPPPDAPRSNPIPIPVVAISRQAPAPVQSKPEPEPKRTPERTPIADIPQPIRLTLAAGTPIRIITSSEISTQTDKTGDRIAMILNDDLASGGNVIARRGSVVRGLISESDPGGRVRGVATISVTLNSLTLANGSTIPVKTNEYSHDAPSSVGKDVARTGVAAGIGAAIGGIFGGGRGAAIGAGAAAGAGAALATHGNPAVIAPETVITFNLVAPLTVTE
jgi:hypothetical protein